MDFGGRRENWVTNSNIAGNYSILVTQVAQWHWENRYILLFRRPNAGSLYARHVLVTDYNILFFHACHF